MGRDSQFAYQGELTLEEFTRVYCRGMGIRESSFHDGYVALPCSCNEPSCMGWIVLPHDMESLRAYRDDYLERVH